jgi:hypothetical protein
MAADKSRLVGVAKTMADHNCHMVDSLPIRPGERGIFYLVRVFSTVLLSTWGIALIALVAIVFVAGLALGGGSAIGGGTKVGAFVTERVPFLTTTTTPASSTTSTTSPRDRWPGS